MKPPRKTKEEYIKKLNEINGNIFDYSKSKFTRQHNYSVYVENVVCKICKNIFKYELHHFKRLKRCVCCYKLSKILKKIKEKNPEFNFNKCQYFIGTKDNDYQCYLKNIECIHGMFDKKISLLFKGIGCIKCIKENMIKSLIEKVKEKHTEYNYDDCKYISGNIKKKTTNKLLNIKCKKHGMFDRLVCDLIQRNSGCIKCTSRISKLETAWLDSLNIPQENRQVKILCGKKQYFVDALMPAKSKDSKGTVYEFDGDYWHGNPNKFDAKKMNKKLKKTFGTLYKKTKTKKFNLQKHGYEVISIWEADWKAQQKKVKAKKL